MQKIKSKKRIEEIAERVSGATEHSWYICRRKGCSDTIVPENQVLRYQAMGYEVVKGYQHGKPEGGERVS